MSTLLWFCTYERQNICGLKQTDMSALWFDEMFSKVEWYSALQGFTQMKTVNRNACTSVGADSDI